MARYHVKADGSMGPCTAQEGHCPFGGDAGVKHFTSESEAQAYAEKIVKTTTDHKGGMKMTKTSNPKVWPTTEHGCHSATYLGWDGDDVIITAGGYVDGVYLRPYEVEWKYDVLWDRLSPEVKAEMPSPDGCDPGDWNDKILELKQRGVSDEDEELLDALWVSGEVCEGEVTIYGTDDGVTRLDESDLSGLGLDRIDDDDEEDEDDDESPTSVTAAPVEPPMTTNSNGLKVTTWPVTEQGVHSATYLGWGGYDEIINAGGWISGEYIAPTDELGLDRAWKSLSPELKDELEEYAGGDPAEWNGKILELEREGKVSDEDAELLDAFWIEGESFNGSVTIYGTNATVSEMDEDDFSRLGLNRLDADELWHLGIIVDDDDATEDEDE